MARTHKNGKISLEQSVLRCLRGVACPGSLLIGCSGGVDSMVLLQALWRLRNVAGLRLAVAYVHHGPGRGAAYRERAWRLVRDAAAVRELPFYSNSPDGKPPFAKPVKGEAALRELRWGCLRQWREAAGLEAIAVAHHYQDLLETRLLRLIRGTGPQGFTSLRVFAPPILRPLLRLDKAELVRYAKLAELPVLEDPSNATLDPFRNWLRRWLTVLEKRHPGATRNMARSLGELAEQLESGPADGGGIMTEGGIDRCAYLALAPGRKKASLAQYCFKLGLKNYTQGHIEELLRRLDDRQKHFTFELLQCVWNVSTDRIEASRV